MFKKIKKFFSKKNLNHIGWKLYHKFRKKTFKKFSKENLEKIKQIPVGAIGTVFGNNVLTSTFQEIRVEDTKVDEVKVAEASHTITGYLGNSNHEIAEADVYFCKNKLERYVGKRIVFHYFKTFTSEDIQEIKRRIYYLLDKEMLYDFMGYAGFVTRPLSFLEKVKFLHASDTTVFCSDGAGVVYHGDKQNTDKAITEWDVMAYISLIHEANKICPADIYLYMHRLYELFPDKVGEIVLEP